jgi:ribosomal RNA small subunit methyltransferase A
MWRRLLHATSTTTSASHPALSSSSTRPLQLLRKPLGQHLLQDPVVARVVARSGDLRPTDHVLEIGPGTGNLTVPLLEECAGVTSIELDEDIAAQCRERLVRLGVAQRARLVLGDALKVPWPRFDAMVANVPYQISSPLLERLLVDHAGRGARVAVLLVQREFAERLTAQPGTSQYSRLSVFATLMTRAVRIVRIVPPTAFRPPPKVDSAVVRLDLWHGSSLGSAEEEGSSSAPELLNVGLGGAERTFAVGPDAFPVQLRAHGERPRALQVADVVAVMKEAERVGVAEAWKGCSAPSADRWTVTVPTREFDSLLKVAFSGKNKTMRSRWVTIDTTVQALAITRDGDAPRAKLDLDNMLQEQGLAALRANATKPELFLRLYFALRALGFRVRAPNALAD